MVDYFRKKNVKSSGTVIIRKGCPEKAGRVLTNGATGKEALFWRNYKKSEGEK